MLLQSLSDINHTCMRAPQAKPCANRQTASSVSSPCRCVSGQSRALTGSTEALGKGSTTVHCFHSESQLCMHTCRGVTSKPGSSPTPKKRYIASNSTSDLCFVYSSTYPPPSFHCSTD
ncbi:hypothetical protein H2248_012562 [Termitomyces sp. 'cryptogamus']|nr:hypothetical protein H2248_012562 [Termitomyces sp. 'cryptogamus']